MVCKERVDPCSMGGLSHRTLGIVKTVAKGVEGDPGDAGGFHAARAPWSQGNIQ